MCGEVKTVKRETWLHFRPCLLSSTGHMSCVTLVQWWPHRRGSEGGGRLQNGDRWTEGSSHTENGLHCSSAGRRSQRSLILTTLSEGLDNISFQKRPQPDHDTCSEVRSKEHLHWEEFDHIDTEVDDVFNFLHLWFKSSFYVILLVQCVGMLNVFFYGVYYCTISQKIILVFFFLQVFRVEYKNISFKKNLFCLYFWSTVKKF